MRTVILTVLLCLFAHLHINSQTDLTLPGLVVEQNSEYNSGVVNYLSGTSIRSPGATPTLSDVAGAFNLIYVQEPFGGKTQVYATKSGYEVVNNKDLENASIVGRRSPLKVVMCKEGTLYQNQLAYYEIARDAITNTYEQSVARLKSEELDQDLLLAELGKTFSQKVESLEEALDLLYRQQQQLEKFIQDISREFVTINLDDESERYKAAFTNFKAGKIDQALEILEAAELEKRLQVNLGALVQEAETSAKLVEDILRREKEMQQDINQVVLKARLHQLVFEFEEAEQSYELALMYDSLNPGIIGEYGKMLDELNQKDKAIDYFERGLANSNNHYFKLYFLNGLGVLYRKTNEKEKSGQFYHKTQEYLTALTPDSPSLYLPLVAGNHNNFGNLYNDIQNFPQAEIEFKAAITIYDRIIRDSLGDYQEDRIQTLNNLATTYYAKGDYALAIPLFKEATAYYRSVASHHTDNSLASLARLLGNLGSIYLHYQQFDSSGICLKEALEISRELVVKNPLAFEPGLSDILTNLGILYLEARQYNKAEPYLLEALTLLEQIVKKSPLAYTSNYAKANFNIGTLYIGKGQLNVAEPYVEKSLSLLRMLAEKTPESFNIYLTQNLNTLAGIYQDSQRPGKAEEMYLESYNIWQTLLSKEPEAKAYLEGFASDLMNFGNLYGTIYEFDKAIEKYNQAVEIRRKLANNNPDVFNVQIAKTYLNMSILYRNRMIKENELSYREQGLIFIKEAEETLSFYSSDNPNVINQKVDLSQLRSFFENTDVKSLEQLFFQGASWRLNSEKDLTKKKQLAITLKEQLQEIAKNIADVNKPAFSNLCGVLSWHLLFVEKFAEAEQAARLGLEVDPSQIWINTNLALAYLYQNKWEEAQAIYLSFKDKYLDDKQSFRETFLEDLTSLEKEIPTHPDSSKVRKLLSE